MTKAELRERYPDAHFIKTKHLVERPNLTLLKDAFIPDDDTPTFPEEITEKTRIYPLSVTAYPSVLRRMTAMEAGLWNSTTSRAASRTLRWIFKFQQETNFLRFYANLYPKPIDKILTGGDTIV